jgi:putative endonuclease
MYFICIIYSPGSGMYYVGYTTDINLRLHKHNNQENFNTFTRKHRPWILAALFSCGDSESEAIKLERFIKKQKSKSLIEKLLVEDFHPTGNLAQLVRVPQVRD